MGPFLSKPPQARAKEIFAKPKEVKPEMTKVPNCILCRLAYHLSPSLGRRFTATWSRVMGSDKQRPTTLKPRS